MTEEIRLQYEIEQALFEEAACLDDRRFDEWLDYFDEELSYRMPLRQSVPPGSEEHMFTDEGDPALFNDDRELLALRVAKLDTGFSWAENPPSRTRHFVFNIRIVERPSLDEVIVESNIIFYRTRLETDEDVWVGSRREKLLARDGGWKIAEREVRLDQTVMESKDLSSFF